MSMNGTSNGGENVLVLYKIVNSETDPEGDHFNAFHMPRGRELTLAAVKHHCSALRALNHSGPDGFHWRVCVEDKPVSGSSSSKSMYSWWDIKDDTASLPIKSASPSELQRLFSGSCQPASSPSSASSTSKAAKGAFKTIGKAMTAVAGAVEGSHIEDHGPRVNMIAFKLLDLVAMHDDFVNKHGSTSKGAHHAPVHTPPVRTTTAAPRRAPAPQARSTPARGPPPQQQGRTPAAARTPAPQQRAAAAPRTNVRASAPPPRAAAPQPEANLMDFGTPPKPMGRKNLQHAQSMPATFNNETRAERLKREYAQNQQKQNRVWDDVDQRWVAVDPKGGPVKASTGSAPPSASTTNSGKKVVGIKLDASNAIGKSANVQAAVNKRVNDMRESQEKAKAEVREREEKKKQQEAEEDAVRKRLEPKVKAWSEEHGKKKQLLALLASLHTILWEGAKWKPVSMGDLLNPAKVKKFYHKATLVVHPDKTAHFDAEKRFLAKRIFDALTQAKVEYDQANN